MTNFNKNYHHNPTFGRGLRNDRASEEAHLQVAKKLAEAAVAENKKKQKKFLSVEITDSLFERDNEENISFFPKKLYSKILKIMCVEVVNEQENKSDSQLLIEKKLALPRIHRDIQVLENFGIKKFFLDYFLLLCGLDAETLDITIFMLKNGFFTREEVLANFEQENPIPFYNPDISIDSDPAIPGSGFSVKSKNRLANLPEGTLEKSLDERIAFVNERFDRLKAAVREDFNSRMAASTKNKSRKLINPALKD